MRIITVESCSKCPYGRSDYFRDKFMIAYCSHKNVQWTNNNWEWHSKAIEDEVDCLSFPSWCPLVVQE